MLKKEPLHWRAGTLLGFPLLWKRRPQCLSFISCVSFCSCAMLGFCSGHARGVSVCLPPLFCRPSPPPGAAGAPHPPGHHCRDLRRGVCRRGVRMQPHRRAGALRPQPDEGGAAAARGPALPRPASSLVSNHKCGLWPFAMQGAGCSLSVNFVYFLDSFVSVGTGGGVHKFGQNWRNKSLTILQYFLCLRLPNFIRITLKGFTFTFFYGVIKMMSI